MTRLTRDEYREVYLRSEHWRTIREGALLRAGYRCQICNAAKHLDVHHRTYERLGSEDSMDLTVLCRPCHDTFHNGGGWQTRSKYKPKRAKTAASDSEGPLSQTAYRALNALIACGNTTSGQMAYILDTTTGEAGALLSELRAVDFALRTKKYWKPTPSGRRAAKSNRAEREKQ